MSLSRIQKMALLSISLVLITAYAITPALPLMAQDFPKVNTADLQLLITAPAAAVMVVVIFTKNITAIVGVKRTILLGLLMVGVFGTMPMIFESYNAILASRIMLGVGFGLINSLAISLIGDFFSGSEKAKMLGFRNLSENIGLGVLMFIASALISSGSWRYGFMIYASALPILGLAYYFIPNVPKPMVQNHGKNLPFTTALVIYTFCVVIAMSAFIGIQVSIPFLFVERALGDAAKSGVILSVLPLVSIIMSFLFGTIFNRVNHRIIVLGAVIFVLGLILTLFADSSAMMLLGVALIGSGFPLFAVGIITFISVIGVKGEAVFSTSFLIFGFNGGSFIAPYIIEWLRALSTMLGVADLLGVFGILSLFTLIFGVVTAFDLPKRIREAH